MTRHKIHIRTSGPAIRGRLDTRLLRRSIRAALRAEGVDAPCEVSVLLTDDAGIRAINRQYRNTDTATDVLSFPLQTLRPGLFAAPPEAVCRDTGLLPLGDIVLSWQRLRAQARLYGQTLGRETAYLAIHSVLHLLGYDHVDEGPDKRRMRAREKAILRKAGFDR